MCLQKDLLNFDSSNRDVHSYFSSRIFRIDTNRTADTTNVPEDTPRVVTGTTTDTELEASVRLQIDNIMNTIRNDARTPVQPGTRRVINHGNRTTIIETRVVPGNNTRIERDQ